MRDLIIEDPTLYKEACFLIVIIFKYLFREITTIKKKSTMGLGAVIVRI